MTERNAATAPPPPFAGEGTPRSGGGEGQRDGAGCGTQRDLSGGVAPLSRPPLTRGPPSPAEGGGRARVGFEPGIGRDDGRSHPRPDPRLRAFAREQRKLHTKAEDAFWQQVRGGRFRGLKFRRQAPIPPYIADFLCASARLIVELDGAPHETEARRTRDAARDAWLRAQGFTVLRFPNDLVASNLKRVLDTVGAALDARATSGTVAPLSRPRLTPGPPSPTDLGPARDPRGTPSRAGLTWAGGGNAHEPRDSSRGSLLP
ncbi:DUF559 domain-containing protein [Methylobacterium sp. NEAU 140]|uniref:endonuclease domain-containing protein n=1 Tax=Methylobacterium sp. NEAU 140 TaxID=3064945 RepID=UPI002736209E|nr:DUF559 domain-containing protein [Methylobacterium sp. NEAU 140]MDP4021628.1 DUF559 domain-containing protein [Methylobacterium sp. NEAU 140]